MRKATPLRWASLGFFALLGPSFAWGQDLPFRGPGPIAPASDSPAYSASPNETLDPPPPRGYAEDIQKAKLEPASMIGVAPGAVQYDRGASAGTGSARPSGQVSVEQERGPTPSAPALTTSFNGISFTGFIPPDPVIAAGPTNLVLSTNGSVTIRDKTGALVAATSLSVFFSSVRATGENAFDPRVVFDAGSNRFFLSAAGRIANKACTAGTCVSHIFLAVSKTSSPATTGSGDWYFYAFDATLDSSTPTTNWADFPGLGVDTNVVVLTANMFSFSADTFQTAKIRILDKSVLINGGAITWTDFFGMTDPSTGFLSFTLQPALTFGSPETFFLVSASQTLHSCDLIVWGIANPLTSPTLSKLKAAAAGTCDVPPNAPQQGGGTRLDTSDTRLYNAVYRNNSLWTAQTIKMNFGSGNVSAIRWVQINVGDWPSSVNFIQDSTFGADGIWYFYPSVMVDASNNLAIILARSSASEFVSAHYTGRLDADPANTLQPSALLKDGTANYQNLDGDGDNRWGDYFGIALDPSDGGIWLLGEYAASSNLWGTWAARIAFAPTFSLLAAVLPAERTALVGGPPVIAFATILNSGPVTALGCGIAPLTVVPATFTYQTTDAQNALTGTPNTPVDIPPGQGQTFVFAFAPTAAFPRTEIALSFACTNSAPAPITPVNTFGLRATTTPAPDPVALVAVGPPNDGILRLASAGAFAVATVNVGASGLITVTADTGGVALPLTLTVCETNPQSGACLAPPSPSVQTQINAGATPTFGVFADSGAAPITFDPTNNRIRVRFEGGGGGGGTGVAVCTQSLCP